MKKIFLTFFVLCGFGVNQSVFGMDRETVKEWCKAVIEVYDLCKMATTFEPRIRQAYSICLFRPDLVVDAMCAGDGYEQQVCLVCARAVFFVCEEALNGFIYSNQDKNEEALCLFKSIQNYESIILSKLNLNCDSRITPQMEYYVIFFHNVLKLDMLVQDRFHMEKENVSLTNVYNFIRDFPSDASVNKAYKYLQRPGTPHVDRYLRLIVFENVLNDLLRGQDLAQDSLPIETRLNLLNCIISINKCILNELVWIYFNVSQF